MSRLSTPAAEGDIPTGMNRAETREPTPLSQGGLFTPVSAPACHTLHALVMSYLGSLVHVRHQQLISEIERLTILAVQIPESTWRKVRSRTLAAGQTNAEYITSIVEAQTPSE